MNIGERIRECRKNAGLSQKELGEKLGVSQAMIAQYENGIRLPKVETIRKIADALEADTLDLLKDISITKEQLPMVIDNELNLLISEQSFDDETYRMIPLYYDRLGKTGKESLKEIIANLRILNNEGQKEAAKRVEELTEIPRYTKPDPSK